MAKVKPPTGPALTIKEREKAIELTASLLIKGHSYLEVTEKVTKKVGVSARTVERYINIVRERWVIDSGWKDIEFKRQLKIEELRRDIAAMKRDKTFMATQGGWFVVLAYQKQLISLEGINKPVQVDINHNVDGTVVHQAAQLPIGKDEIDYNSLPIDILEKIVEHGSKQKETIDLPTDSYTISS